MRVVLDTNIVVSSFIVPTGSPAKVLERMRDGAYELFISEDILAEYLEILQEDSISARHGYTQDEISRLVAEIEDYAFSVIPQETHAVVALDPDDDKFIECAVAAGADYIVSGDKHLLTLKEYAGIQILSPAAFLLLLEAERR